MGIAKSLDSKSQESFCDVMKWSCWVSPAWSASSAT